MEMTTNGLVKLSQLEGWRASIYVDEGGKATIGYGHKLTLEDKQTGRFERGLSKAEGWDLFREDVARFEVGVNELVKRPLKDHEFNALVCFAYNLGLDRLRKSRLLLFVNVEQGHGVPHEFMRWVHVTSKTGEKARSPGLVKRRLAEVAMWEGR